MTFLKRSPCALALALFALTAGARAQSTAIEVASDEGRVEFSSPSRPAEMRVEVFAPSGELVFDSGAVFGRSVEWKMQDAAGARVADGVYLATVTVMDGAGKRRKRIEQVTVSSEAAAAAPVPTTSAPVDGAGTPGKIAKFTGANTVGDSVITESASARVGVGTVAAPTAVLEVHRKQPAPLAVNGTAATTLLQTSGGKGGNTTAGGGKLAGAGASISLVAGNGGDAPATSKRGNGGSINLQPGSTGAGAGIAGANGNVLLAPNGVGNVAVGTNTAPSRLTVAGNVQISGAGSGLKFPDGSVQTKAFNSVSHNATLAGLGTGASPLGIAPLGVTSAYLANDAVGVPKLNMTNAPTAGQVLTYNGSALAWQTPAGGGGGGVTAFRHTRTAATNCGPAGLTNEFSPLSHASINGNPNAKIFVTAIVGITTSNSDANQNYFIVYTGSTSFGNCPANRWLIRGGDADPANFDGAQYNVLIVN
ncbi:MAG TPA: hypothetical protein VN256_16720 [Pyrinomonadaceae bacterium]|nr:hypothetical protein [Pyrinomonadaceae bacterium]